VGPVLVGRSAETAVLHEVVDAVAHGHGAFLHLVGEAGVGKSSLLRVATEELQRRSVAVHAACVDENDRRRHLSLIRALLPEARWRAEPDAVSAAVAEVERLTTASPVAILVDDVHWADATAARRSTTPASGALGGRTDPRPAGVDRSAQHSTARPPSARRRSPRCSGRSSGCRPPTAAT
jgi:predicted ATPase